MSPPRRVLITGASGFIGRHLVVRLAGSGWRVRAAARDPAGLAALPGIEPVQLGDLAGPFDWTPLLRDVSHVIHLAGIAHATSAIPEATYHAVNAAAAGALAYAARACGLERVVMISSIRAQCGASAEGVVTEDDRPAPVDAYGRSKLAGETSVAAALAGSPTSWCVLRPVLVYGAGVKGNMATLLGLARSPWPLPLGGLTARRSLLGLSNLSAAVEHALDTPAVAGRTCLVADPGPLTVPAIIAAMREGLHRRPSMFHVPLSPLRLAATLTGREAAWQRIAGDLVVSTARLEATGWQPLESAAEGIARWMQAR